MIATAPYTARIEETLAAAANLLLDGAAQLAAGDWFMARLLAHQADILCEDAWALVQEAGG